ncbi:MAG TPA: hypothetical protein VFC99_18015 [Acidimicrobiia bacterium]|nr:hypothetical protein [Acidimicrobiia bacterium]
MTNLIRVVAAAVFTGAVVAMVAGAASGHELDRTSITCTTVSGTFHDFGAHDHPIVWHVKLGAGASATVATTETPAAFVGAGTASADIAALTATLDGATATVTAYATWPGGQSAATTASVTCGTPAVAPPQVGGIETQAPVAAPSVLAAATPVPAAARFTG